jgi:hypothetical protein
MAENDFQTLAAGRRQENSWGDLWGFLLASKKWWLVPVLLVLFLLGALMLLSGTAAAPFIYTLF